jgi:hypothetical protein
LKDVLAERIHGAQIALWKPNDHPIDNHQEVERELLVLGATIVGFH